MRSEFTLLAEQRIGNWEDLTRPRAMEKVRPTIKLRGTADREHEHVVPIVLNRARFDNFQLRIYGHAPGIRTVIAHKQRGRLKRIKSDPVWFSESPALESNR